MKLITIAGPPSSGKTSVIIKTAKILKKSGLKLGVVKFDSIATADDLTYKKAGLPVVPLIHTNIRRAKKIDKTLAEIKNRLRRGKQVKENLEL